MKTQKRWMKSIIAEAAKEQPAMPWQRGNRRAEMIARRIKKGSVKVAMQG